MRVVPYELPHALRALASEVSRSACERLQGPALGRTGAVRDRSRPPSDAQRRKAFLLDSTALASAAGATVGELEATYDGSGYGDFKAELAEAVNGYLRPVRLRHAELTADPGAVREVLRKGADRAEAVAAETLAAVRERVGFLT